MTERAAAPWWARHPYLLLTAVALAWIGVRHAGPAADWDYLREGSDLLLGHRTLVSSTAVVAAHASIQSGGLHLFAHYPEIQVGPLTLLLVAAIRWVSGPYGRVVTVSLGTLLCVPTIWLLDVAAARVRPVEGDPRGRALLVLVGGSSVLAVWTQATLRYAHVDDALVLFFAALAVWAVVRVDALALGTACALAVAAKPTGLILLPLLLVLTGRRRLVAGLVAAAGVASVWLPFVLADPGTLQAGSPTIQTAQATALHVLGLHGYLHWVRAAQLVLSLGVGLIAVLRGRWPAALLAAAAGRLLLEPGAVSYYTTGIVLGALAWEALSVQRARGLVTASVCAAFYLVPYQAVYSLLPYHPLLTGRLDGWLRLGSCLALILAVTAVPQRWWPAPRAAGPVAVPSPREAPTAQPARAS
ncbi:MAG: hypothetical protein QOI76_400 [Frankiales bacterium]|nr:hypothetical protein [Frankiales bacterium]